VKKLLSWGGVTLLTSAFLDPMIQSGLGNEVPWGRDVAMACAGCACLFLLVRFRNEL
jgi:hypothetical protein